MKGDKLVLEKILPSQVDNAYSGHRLSLVFFYFITLLTICRSCVHIFAGDGGAQSIATIPLDAFTQGGAEGVIFLFAQWGIAQLMIGLIYLEQKSLMHHWTDGVRELSWRFSKV